MTPKRNPGIRKSSCFLIYKSTLWNLQDRYTHNLQRSTGYQFSRVRYYVLSYGQKYIITFKHKTERCSFLFWFIWLTAFETRSTHTHNEFLSFSEHLQTKGEAVFVLFLSLGGTQNQSQSCPRRYLKWPLGDPLEGQKTSTNLDFSRFGPRAKIDDFV